MSRGRGHGKSIANSLGLQRYELPLLQSSPACFAPPALYPHLNRRPIPIEKDESVEYMAELNQELLTRLNESSHYVKLQEKTTDVKRYTDKYKPRKESSFEPDWSRLPAELCPKTSKGDKARKSIPAKKPKISASTAKLEELEKLEAAKLDEGQTSAEVKDNSAVKESDGEDEDKKEEELLSDDDYQEEDNDYIQSYFDNGEDFGDGSDENLEDDAVY